MDWKRPDEVPGGQVWRKFDGRIISGTPARRYQIRDVDLKDKDSYLDFLEEFFLPDEPLCQALDIISDRDSVATIRGNWYQDMVQGVSLACYAEEQGGHPEELVAFDLCVVKCAGVKEEVDFTKIKGEPWKKLLRVLMAVEDSDDVFKHYNVDKYFTSNVLAVAPTHRGHNIAVHMFKSTETIAKALGLNAMATMVTALSSQRVAAKCGYEVISEFPYANMAHQGIHLDNCSTPSAKIVGTVL